MYATKADIENRISAETLVLLADDNRDGTADENVVDAALLQASGRIDAILGCQYALPLESVPPMIQWACVSLAVLQLYARRREALPREHEILGKAAMEFLSFVRTGEIVLPGQALRRLARSTTLGEEKHFSAERLEEY